MQGGEGRNGCVCFLTEEMSFTFPNKTGSLEAEAMKRHKEKYKRSMNAWQSGPRARRMAFPSRFRNYPKEVI